MKVALSAFLLGPGAVGRISLRRSSRLGTGALGAHAHGRGAGL